MSTTPTHPTGTITQYTDAAGRSQTSVTGPRGHVLVTRTSRYDPYTVWFSDSLATLATTRDIEHALDVAQRATGFPA